MKIRDKTGTARVVCVSAGGKFTAPFFIWFLGYFRKMGGVTAQYEICAAGAAGRRGGDGGKYRNRDAGGCGEAVLPKLRRGGYAKRQGPSKDILLGLLQVCLEEQASASGKVEIHPDCHLPGMRQAILGKPGIRKGEEILQPCLCQPGTGGKEGGVALEKGLETIGVFAVCNTGGICVHAVDHGEEKVLASMNGKNPQWYEMAEKPLSEITGDEKDKDVWETGFLFGSFFVPFSEVMRV